MAFTKSLIIWEKSSTASEKEIIPLTGVGKFIKDKTDAVKEVVDDVTGKVSSKLSEYGLIDNDPVEDITSSYRVLNLNCVLTEAHSITNEVTSYPISNGFIVSDHVIKRNPVFKLSGWVTNVNMPESQISISTVGKVAGAMVSRSMGPVIGSLLGSAASIIDNLAMSGNPVKDTFEELKKVIQQGTIVHVATLVGTYENCVIRSMEISQNVVTATVLPITLTFEQLQIIDPSTGDFMATGTNAALKKALEEQTESALESAFGMLSKSGVNIFAEWGLGVGQ
jgi:hypothetical protein